MANLNEQDAELFAHKILSEKEIQAAFGNVISENKERAMHELLDLLYPLLQETIRENIMLEESISKNMKFLPRRLTRNKNTDQSDPKWEVYFDGFRRQEKHRGQNPSAP